MTLPPGNGQLVNKGKNSNSQNRSPTVE